MKRQELWNRITNIPLLFSAAKDLLLDFGDKFSNSGFAQIYQLVQPYTMCGNTRLRSLYHGVQYVGANQIEGDLVECGAARGGSAALIALAASAIGDSRTLWVFDTFAGIPAPSFQNPDWKVARLYEGDFRGTLEEVSALFSRLGILKSSHLVKGLVQDTVPAAPIQKIALLHIDTDWYESVSFCLEHLYDKVSPGGVIQFDDYGHWKGAKKAVDEFFHHRAIKPELRTIDYAARQMIVPSEV